MPRENASTVRELRPTDTHRAAEIDRLCVDDLRKIYRPTEAARRHRSNVASELRGLVAEIDGRAVGVVRYRIAAGRLSFLGLGVHPAARRRGVATALIQRLEHLARDCGCTAVSLHTVRETGNVAIFERFGFVVESEKPTDLFVSETFPTLSEVAMSKRIVPLRRFSPAVATAFDKSKIIGVRAGARSSHRFTGIWVVVVAGRVFARSWTRRPDGWFSAFLEDAFGVIEMGSRRIRIRAIRSTGERVRDAVERAYAAKYSTPASMKYVRGFRSPRRRDTTIEFVPR